MPKPVFLSLYSCLNIKELLAQNRHNIWSLNDFNGTQTHNHLVCKQKLNHLAKLAKWLSCVVSTYLYSALDCMFLSCHLCISEWILSLSPHRQTTTGYLLSIKMYIFFKYVRLNKIDSLNIILSILSIFIVQVIVGSVLDFTSGIAFVSHHIYFNQNFLEVITWL